MVVVGWVLWLLVVLMFYFYDYYNKNSLGGFNLHFREAFNGDLLYYALIGTYYTRLYN